MDKLHLSDLAWIGAIVLAYWFVSSGAPAAIFRQVQRSLGRTPPPPLRRVMSRPASMRPSARVAARVAATSTIALPGIAKPGNAINAGLTGNAELPGESRDIIRMQAKAEAVAALLRSGKLTNKAEAIELIFDCRRSGRATSAYQQALALVDRQIERFPNRTPEQEQVRAELGLTTR